LIGLPTRLVLTYAVFREIEPAKFNPRKFLADLAQFPRLGQNQPPVLFYPPYPVQPCNVFEKLQLFGG